MTNLVKVTTEELTNVLMNLPNGIGSFAKVTQYTTPKTNKKCRDTKEPFNSVVRKVSDVSVIVATQYERNVLNQLKREDKEPTDYKKGFNTMPIDFDNSKNTYAGMFKGKGVIQYRPNPNEKVKAITQYYLNNKAVQKSEIPNVLPTVKKATNQGTEKEILWRKLYVQNIKTITIGKKTYENIECTL
jgi:hypothetical protein